MSRAPARSSVLLTLLALLASLLALTAPLAAPASASTPSSAGVIAFTRLTGIDQTTRELWTMKADGGSVKRLTTNTAQDHDPAWSKDGSRLAWVQGVNAGSWTIRVANPDGSGQATVYTASAALSSLSWSPDGTQIVFAVSTSPMRIFRVPVSGGSAVEVGEALGDQPDWSPTGRIAFRRQVAAGTYKIYSVQPDGTGLTQLSPGVAGNEHHPTFNRDGSRITFSSDQAGPDQDLYVANADGTDRSRVGVHNSHDETVPSFTADGASLLFHRPAATPFLTSVIQSVPVTGGAVTYVSDDAQNHDDATMSPALSSTPPVETTPGTATGSTSAGQSMAVSIATPAHGSGGAAGDPLQVTGTVALSQDSSRPYHAAYVVDVSGSTSAGPYDCNGDGLVGSPLDNLNGDVRSGDVLDCEIASVLALNDKVAAVPSATAAVVALGASAHSPTAAYDTSSALADVSEAVGEQSSTGPGALDALTSNRRIDSVLRSMTWENSLGLVRRYTPKSINSGTHYDHALRRMLGHFREFPGGETSVGYFLSDGEPGAGTFTTGTGSPLWYAMTRGVRIFTYGVGGAAGGCASGQPLERIATLTGGTCTAFTNPASLPVAIGTPATLSGVSVKLADGTPVVATLDTSVTPATFTATLPARLAGPQTLAATATASDGSAVTASITITGTAAPVVDAGGPYTVPEGSTVGLTGTVTDLDGGTPTLAWTPANRLSGAGTATPTYAATDDGTETLTLTAEDADGLVGSDTADVTTTNVSPVLGAVGLSPSPSPGVETALSLDFTDAGALDTHTATVDWGDGTRGPATVTQASGGGSISGAHTYAPGTYTIEVTVVDDDGGSSSTQHGPFRVNRAPVVSAGGPYVVDEGDALTLAGQASDDPGEALTLSWTPSSRLTGATTATPSYDTSDDAHETLTFRADDGDLDASQDTTVTVRNVAPTVGALTGVPSGVITPGSTVTVGATYTDPGAGDTHSAVIDWGDGTTTPTTAAGGVVAPQSHAYGAGRFTITVTVTDDDGGAGSRTATVSTNRAPTADAGPDLVVDEGTLTTLLATATDEDGDPLTYSWSVSGTAGAVGSSTALQPLFEAVDDGLVTLTVTVTDPYGAQATDALTVTVRNVAPVLGAVTGSGPRALGTAAEVSGTWTDPGVADTHSVRLDWGDGTSSAATAADGAWSGSHTYAAAGVHTVTVTVTDDDGGTATTQHEYLVVYDPSAGFVTGGGWVQSPAGAMPAAPDATGKASFGFVAKYEKGKSVPTGQTQFRFSAGDLEFRSTSYEWLVVSGTRATYRGAGTVGDVPGYAFQLSAADGDRRGGDGVDRFRMKITEMSTGNVVYDNQTGAAEDAAPTTSLSGGSIVIHG